MKKLLYTGVSVFFVLIVYGIGREYDLAIVETIQSLGEGWRPVMAMISQIGDGYGVMAVAIIWCWCWDYKNGIRLGTLLYVSTMSNAFLKFATRQVRPYALSETIVNYEGEGGYGMPSGAAQSSATFLGFIEQQFHTTIYTVIGVICVAIIAISRMYLGVHSFTQVFVGAVLGFFIARILMKYDHKIWQWLEQKPLRQSLTYLLIACLMLCIILILIMAAYGDFTKDGLAAVSEDSVEIWRIQRGLVKSLMYIGALFGFVSGALIVRKKGEIEVKTSFWKQIIKVIVILLTMLVYFICMGILRRMFPSLFLLAFAQCILNIIFGLWLSCLAPLLYTKLHLASWKPQTIVSSYD